MDNVIKINFLPNNGIKQDNIKNNHLNSVFQSLQVTFSDKKKKYSDRLQALLFAWERIVIFVSESNSGSFRPEFDLLFQNTLELILSGKWSNLNGATKTHLTVTLERFTVTLSNSNNYFSILRETRVLEAIVKDPWQYHSVLRKILKDEEIERKEAADYFKLENGKLIVTRLEILLQSKCEVIAVRLSKQCLDCYSYDDEQEDDYENPFNSDILLDITGNELEYISDIYICCLFKLKKKEELLSVLKKWELNYGLELLKRYRCCGAGGKYNGNCEDARVWKKGPKILEMISDTLIVNAITHEELLDSDTQLQELITEWASIHAISSNGVVSPVALKMIHKCVLLAESSKCIYPFCSLLISNCGAEEYDLNHVSSCLIRALIKNMNEIEQSKVIGEKEKLKEMHDQLSKGFLMISELFKDSNKIFKECLLTSFSLMPSHECLQKIETFVSAAENKEFDISLQKSEDESIVSEPNPINLRTDVSTFEYENINTKTEDDSVKFVDTPQQNRLENYTKEAPSAYIAEVENLKLDDSIRTDLNTILRYQRHHKLQSNLNWPELKGNCEKYLEEFETKAFDDVELKYLDLDYNQFKDTPLTEEDEQYGGIEKGYEQYIDSSEYLEDDLLSDTDLDSDFDEDYSVTRKKRENKVKKKRGRKPKPKFYINGEYDKLYNGVSSGETDFDDRKRSFDSDEEGVSFKIHKKRGRKPKYKPTLRKADTERIFDDEYIEQMDVELARMFDGAYPQKENDFDVSVDPKPADLFVNENPTNENDFGKIADSNSKPVGGVSDVKQETNERAHDIFVNENPTNENGFGKIADSTPVDGVPDVKRGTNERARDLFVNETPTNDYGFGKTADSKSVDGVPNVKRETSERDFARTSDSKSAGIFDIKQEPSISDETFKKITPELMLNRVDESAVRASDKSTTIESVRGGINISQTEKPCLKSQVVRDEPTPSRKFEVKRMYKGKIYTYLYQKDRFPKGKHKSEKSERKLRTSKNSKADSSVVESSNTNENNSSDKKRKNSGTEPKIRKKSVRQRKIDHEEGDDVAKYCEQNERSFTNNINAYTPDLKLPFLNLDNNKDPVRIIRKKRSRKSSDLELSPHSKVPITEKNKPDEISPSLNLFNGKSSPSKLQLLRQFRLPLLNASTPVSNDETAKTKSPPSESTPSSPTAAADNTKPSVSQLYVKIPRISSEIADELVKEKISNYTKTATNSVLQIRLQKCDSPILGNLLTRERNNDIKMLTKYDADSKQEFLGNSENRAPNVSDSSTINGRVSNVCKFNSNNANVTSNVSNIKTINGRLSNGCKLNSNNVNNVAPARGSNSRKTKEVQYPHNEDAPLKPRLRNQNANGPHQCRISECSTIVADRHYQMTTTPLNIKTQQHAYAKQENAAKSTSYPSSTKSNLLEDDLDNIDNLIDINCINPNKINEAIDKYNENAPRSSDCDIAGIDFTAYINECLNLPASGSETYVKPQQARVASVSSAIVSSTTPNVVRAMSLPRKECKQGRPRTRKSVSPKIGNGGGEPVNLYVATTANANAPAKTTAKKQEQHMEAVNQILHAYQNTLYKFPDLKHVPARRKRTMENPVQQQTRAKRRNSNNSPTNDAAQQSRPYTIGTPPPPPQNVPTVTQDPSRSKICRVDVTNYQHITQTIDKGTSCYVVNANQPSRAPSRLPNYVDVSSQYRTHDAKRNITTTAASMLEVTHSGSHPSKATTQTNGARSAPKTTYTAANNVENQSFGVSAFVGKVTTTNVTEKKKPVAVRRRQSTVNNRNRNVINVNNKKSTNNSVNVCEYKTVNENSSLNNNEMLGNELNTVVQNTISSSTLLVPTSSDILKNDLKFPVIYATVYRDESNTLNDPAGVCISIPENAYPGSFYGNCVFENNTLLGSSSNDGVHLKNQNDILLSNVNTGSPLMLDNSKQLSVNTVIDGKQPDAIGYQSGVIFYPNNSYPPWQIMNYGT